MYPFGCFYNGEIPGGDAVGCTPIQFFAERSVNQTIGPLTQVVIDTDLVVQEHTPGTWDLVNNRFTCTVKGIYVFCLSVDMEFFGGAYGISALRVNGTIRTDEQAEAVNDDYIRIGNSFCWEMDIDDYLDAIVFNGDSFFNATLVGCQNQISGALICPT